MKSALPNIMIALTAILSMPSAHAEKVGNGGVAVVCRDPKGKIASAETLDLFEGRNQFSLTYPATAIGPETIIELAQLKMTSRPAFLKQFQSTLSQVRAATVFLPSGVGLTPTDDAFPVIAKKGCAFEQLANYKDEDSKIYVDQEIYSNLSSYDKAALFIHETTYKMARVNRGESSSVRSRKLTAQTLASNADRGVIEALMDSLSPKPIEAPKPQYPVIPYGIYDPENDAEVCAELIDPGTNPVPGIFFLKHVAGIDRNLVYHCNSGRYYQWNEHVMGLDAAFYAAANEDDAETAIVKLSEDRFAMILNGGRTKITFRRRAI